MLGATPGPEPGRERLLTLTLPAAGTYITFCSLPGHESLGVKGTLVVVGTTPMGSPSASPMASPAA